MTEHHSGTAERSTDSAPGEGLCPEGSVLDMVLRGFDREQVLDATGEDPGYHGRAVRERLAGVDRKAYRGAHVRERVPQDEVLALLEAYAAAGRAEDLRDGLGIGGSSSVKLKDVLAAAGLAEEFVEADRARRRLVMQRGMAAAHGVSNPFEMDSVQRKAAQTRQDRYGAAYTLQAGSALAESARAAIAARMADPQARARVLARRKATWLARRGVEHPMQDPAVLRVRRMRSLLTHGTGHPMQTAAARAQASARARRTAKVRAVRARATSLERYGVEHPSQLPEARAAQSERMLDEAHQDRIVAARKANGTMSTSSPEQELLALLVERFGPEDVVTQYRDKRYPFAVDAYVPSRDLFVELNATWTHGGHWFDAASPADQAVLTGWSAKGSGYYANAVQTWTRRDVAKRAAAAAAGLNYVVFWDPRLWDARLWLACGAPDAQDHVREHSWLELPESLRAYEAMPPAGTGPRQLSDMARWANEEVFWAREKRAWAADEPARWGRTRAWLMANRFRYTGVLPDTVTHRALLRGFGISALLRPYSTFDATAMGRWLDRVAPEHVHDPCAGWGERMALCAQRGVRYTGTDVSSEVVAGHARMTAGYGWDRQRAFTQVADAGAFDARGLGHDAVFTCPPYGDTEIYTEAGAENLGEAEFLAWWGQVVRNCTGPGTRAFAYQVNQRWADRMDEQVLAAGWRADGVLEAGGVRSSHLNRRGGSVNKTQFETVRMFVRD